MKKSDEISWKKQQLCNMLNSFMVQSLAMFHSWGYILGTESIGEEVHRELSVARHGVGVLQKQPSGRSSEADKIRILMKNIGTLFWDTYGVFF